MENRPLPNTPPPHKHLIYPSSPSHKRLQQQLLNGLASYFNLVHLKVGWRVEMAAVAVDWGGGYEAKGKEKKKKETDDLQRKVQVDICPGLKVKVIHYVQIVPGNIPHLDALPRGS